jgi:uncharacterized protein
MTVYPLSVARALAIHLQGLDRPLGAELAPSRDNIYRIIEQLGCLQIDTLQMVRRSQYIALWSRLGTYNPADLDALTFGTNNGANDRRLFEYWLHAACIIPLTRYRYRLKYMNYFRERGRSQWWDNWLAQDGNAQLVRTVFERIRQEGALRTNDFEHDGSPRGTWWDWKPAKRALELLYDQGELMIANRINFNRVYDIRERVLPDWVDTSEPTQDETDRHLIDQAGRALGIFQPLQASDYAYMKRGDAKPTIAALKAEGVFVEVNVEMLDGSHNTLLIHRDNLPLLEKAADGAIVPQRTTFLTPFDSLLWAKGRDQQLWNFRHILEAYKPEPIREWGYFCLPILHNDRLIGRFDPKLERKTGTLRLKSLYLEPGYKPDDILVSGIAAAMRDFLKFHNATTLVIEKSTPVEFGEKLSKVI